jgi:hypothetical protein
MSATAWCADYLRELRRGGQDPEVRLRPAPRVPQRAGPLQEHPRNQPAPLEGRNPQVQGIIFCKYWHSVSQEL